MTMRAMYSVLDIREKRDRIGLHHTSFREYLIDPTRSHNFHIDIPAQQYVLARRWLQALATKKMSSYRYEILLPHREAWKYSDVPR